MSTRTPMPLGTGRALRPASPDAAGPAQVYLVGAGIASLAAAVFLIRDGGVRGEDIHLLEELPRSGGSLDGSGSAGAGYVTRGGRMLEDEVYNCLWELLEGIPSLVDPGMSVREEILAFSAAHPTNAGGRLIDRRHAVLDAADLGFDLRDRLDLARLLATPERTLGRRRIDGCFTPHFFATRFWAMWRTTFAFQQWHSAAELRRYLLRFAQELPRIHTLAGVLRTPLNQYDSIVRPIEAWLADRGVVTEHGVRVSDAEIVTDGDTRRVGRLRLQRNGIEETVTVTADDLVFVTLGSMTADATYGDDTTAPEQVTDRRSGAWPLWRAIACQGVDLGHPSVFDSDVAGSAWQSFTLTLRSPELLRRIEAMTGNPPGEGGLMTFIDSGWSLSIVVPHQPHFTGQPSDVATLWGYGLTLDKPGDHVTVTLAEATGHQILIELAGQLGVTDIMAELRETTTVIPVAMPYITSQFATRAPGDRPEVVPAGATNFAFLGQFVEIPGDVVFTVEYSVHSALLAVRQLLDLSTVEPAPHRGLRDPRVGLRVLAAALR